jgi:hypothetical protein
MFERPITEPGFARGVVGVVKGPKLVYVERSFQSDSRSSVVEPSCEENVPVVA